MAEHRIGVHPTPSLLIERRENDGFSKPSDK
jgi:hypothetical protein